MQRTLSTAAAVFCLLVPASAGGQVDSGDYGVRPGDQIITDFYTAGGEPLGAVQGSRLVDRLGNVFYPYVGTVKVEGLDAEEIRVLLTDRFQPFYNDPVITVNVELRVNITGSVGQAGHYLLAPTSTIVDALATAGGTGSEVAFSNQAAADASAVRLVREGETYILDLRPENSGAEIFDMRIQSGDWIHVPPQRRSQLRDDIQFWGSVLSLVTSVAAVVVLLGR